MPRECSQLQVPQIVDQPILSAILGLKEFSVKWENVE